MIQGMHVFVDSRIGRAFDPGALQANHQQKVRVYDAGGVGGKYDPCRSLLCGFFLINFNLFVCGISLTSGQLFNELFPDCTRSCFSQVVSRRRGGDHIYEMRCPFVAVGPNARFIVLPHWNNMSQAHMISHPVTLY